ncbi:MAG TPA: hypothetical protein VE177_02615, partial [Candidatus Binatus sp.]|nr:hypothetical protein [Candidatus Binatus sp.]
VMHLGTYLDLFTGAGLLTWSSEVDMYLGEGLKTGADAGVFSQDLGIRTLVYFWGRISMTGPQVFVVTVMRS